MGVLEEQACWNWLYKAEAANLGLAVAWNQVPAEKTPIILGRIRFPRSDCMTLEVNSIPRAIAGDEGEMRDSWIRQRISITEDVPLVEDLPLYPEEEHPGFLEPYNILTLPEMRALEHRRRRDHRADPGARLASPRLPRAPTAPEVRGRRRLLTVRTLDRLTS